MTQLLNAIGAIIFVLVIMAYVGAVWGFCQRMTGLLTGMGPDAELSTREKWIKFGINTAIVFVPALIISIVVSMTGSTR